MKSTHIGIALGLTLLLIIAVVMESKTETKNKINGAEKSENQQVADKDSVIDIKVGTTTVAKIDPETNKNLLATATSAKMGINTNTNINKKTMNEQNIGGMIVVDEVIGTGAVAVSGQSVTVHYSGSLTNGKIFDASRNRGNQGFTFDLGAGQVIKGWDLGVAGMKVGGKRKLTIPSDMAYGNQDVGGGLIPANSTLIFEVELLKVGK